MSEPMHPYTTGRRLARVVAELQLGEATLDELDRLVESRQGDEAAAAEL